MLPAIHIKKTIDFNKDFKALLEVLKLVAVSEYHRLEKSLKTFEPLKEVVKEFFNSIDLEQINHPFLNKNDKPVCILAVTSDTGLLGGINNQVITKAVDLLYEHKGRLVVVGGEAHFPHVIVGEARRLAHGQRHHRHQAAQPKQHDEREEQLGHQQRVGPLAVPDKSKQVVEHML